MEDWHECFTSDAVDLVKATEVVSVEFDLVAVAPDSLDECEKRVSTPESVPIMGTWLGERHGSTFH